MKKIKFFSSLFAALYCIFFGIMVLFASDVSEKWYLFGLCIIAAGFYFGFSWNNRPSQWWLC